MAFVRKGNVVKKIEDSIAANYRKIGWTVISEYEYLEMCGILNKKEETNKEETNKEEKTSKNKGKKE